MDMEGMVLSPFDYDIQFQCMEYSSSLLFVAMATGAWPPSSPSGARLGRIEELTHSLTEGVLRSQGFQRDNT